MVVVVVGMRISLLRFGNVERGVIHLVSVGSNIPIPLD